MTDEYRVNEAALALAITYSHDKWEYKVEEDLLRSLIKKMNKKYREEGYTFGEAQRFSLNELFISPKGQRRDAYRSASSRYFNENSRLARRARTDRQAPKKDRPTNPPEPKILLENDQYKMEL